MLGEFLEILRKKNWYLHYISYKSVIGEWIRNDDHLVHIAQIEGEYKVNLVFYQAMVSAPAPMFYLNIQCIRYWWKSVVIRGVYNKRGSGRGRGRGHGGRGTTARAVKDVEPENLILPDDSTSSEEEESKGT